MIFVGLVGHVSRLNMIEELSKHAAFDHYSIDDGMLGCTANHTAVLRWHHRNVGATTDGWSVVMEDDAAPIPQFAEHIADILASAPTPLVSFYLGRLRPPQWQPMVVSGIAKALDESANFIVGSRLLHAVAYAVHNMSLPSLCGWLSVHVDEPTPIDEQITLWAQTHGLLVSYCWPSIVDHKDTPSIEQHRDGQPRQPGRTAHRTGTTDWATTRLVMM